MGDYSQAVETPVNASAPLDLPASELVISRGLLKDPFFTSRSINMD